MVGWTGTELSLPAGKKAGRLRQAGKLAGKQTGRQTSWPAQRMESVNAGQFVDGQGQGLAYKLTSSQSSK